MGGKERDLRRGNDDPEATASEVGVGLLHPQVAGHDARRGGDLARQGLRVRTGRDWHYFRILILSHVVQGGTKKPI